jgi:hypothetical protein
LNLAEGNIGSGERRKRLILGIASLAVALGILLLNPMDSLISWLLLFLLLWMAGLGLFQAGKRPESSWRREVCNLGRGEERMEDEATRSSLRRMATKIHIKAMVTAIVLTGFARLLSS